MRLTVSFIDIVLILLYLAVILYVGFVISTKNKTTNSKINFILAGRKLTTPMFVATLVATWYGNILGIGEFVYNYGLVAWICFGVVYYITAIAYALFFARKIRNSDKITIPERMQAYYGKKAGIAASFIILIITIPAAYILMLGIMISLFTGWNLELSIILGTIASIIYLYKGGFKSDVLTNYVQFIIMYIGFGVLTFFTITQYGSPLDIIELLPPTHTKVFGNFSIMYILAWFFIAFQTFVDPSFYQRCAAANSSQTARKGILISVSLWLIFDIMTLITGMYARAFFADIDAVMAFPALGEAILPSFWKGLFIIALLSTIMSTLDSYTFISAATFGNDLLKPIFSNYSVTQLTQYGLVLTGILGIALAIILPSPIELVFRTSSVAIPGLIMPLVFTYLHKYKISPIMALITMLSSSSVAFLWLMVKIYDLSDFVIFSLEPMLAGIIVSVIIGLLGLRKSVN